MKNWLTSLNGTITLSVIALLTFLGRAFMDWRYEYPQQDPIMSTFDRLPGLAQCLAMELVESDFRINCCGRAGIPDQTKKDSRLTSISNWPPAKSGNRVMINPNPAPPSGITQLLQTEPKQKQE